MSSAGERWGNAPFRVRREPRSYALCAPRVPIRGRVFEPRTAHSCRQRVGESVRRADSPSRSPSRSGQGSQNAASEAADPLSLTFARLRADFSLPVSGLTWPNVRRSPSASRLCRMGGISIRAHAGLQSARTGPLPGLRKTTRGSALSRRLAPVSRLPRRASSTEPRTRRSLATARLALLAPAALVDTHAR